MLSETDKQPLGILLQSAGLITQQQLQTALNIQAEYSQMKLGEILILQEIIKPQTVDFFVAKWGSFRREGQQFFLGYYLKDAGLLDERQIDLILAEQEINTQNFGEIAANKGWIDQKTVEFFVANLAHKAPQIISSDILENYDSNKFNLANKYLNANLILTRILAWTGGNFILAKIVYHAFAQANFNLNSGQEILAVDKLVEDSLIQNWQTEAVGEHVQFLRYRLLNNSNCDPIELLKAYQEILLTGNQKYQQTAAQNELLTLGLAIKQTNQLKVSSLIYQQIFDRDWLFAQITKLEPAELTNKPQTNKYIALDSEVEELEVNELIPQPQSPQSTERDRASKEAANELQKPSKSDAALETNIDDSGDRALRDLTTEPARNSSLVNTSNNSLEPITKVGSFITLLGIVLFIPIVWAINNYYSAISSNVKPEDESLASVEKLEQYCQNLDLLDSQTSLKLIAKLETSRSHLNESSPAFPSSCKVALNKLRVLSAPQLGKENRVIEAVKNLCQVPVDSESLNEAKIWLDHWFNSPGWGKKTRQYLTLTSECPANDR